jgi:PAS domain S-box-containing protein
MDKIALLAQGTRGQIQLFMDQPLTSLHTMGKLINSGSESHKEDITRILNTYSHDSMYFESIYLLDLSGKVINAGLLQEREHYRQDLLGINLGHIAEFKTVLKSGRPEWSNTFLSLSSGKISLTLYVPVGKHILAADINLNALAQLINRLSTDNVVTMVIDRNGAIMFHPDPKLVGKSIMVNDIGIVSAALAGKGKIGKFSFMGKIYLGSTSSIEPVGWVSLIAEPYERLQSHLLIPLLIFGSGIFSAAVLSLFLAFYKAKKLARPLTEITAKSSVIAQGDYSRPLLQSGFTELEQLADSINHMMTAIQKREEELRDKELKYRELVENTSNLVLRLEHDFTISYANHTIFRLTGISALGAIGIKISDFIVPEDRQAMEDTISSGASSQALNETLQCRMAHIDGSLSHLLMTVNMHYTLEGRLRDLNIIGHDITERHQIEQQQKEMEEQRQQSQKMELLGLMAGGVAHDLNNILAGIINYPELMLLKLEHNSPLRPPLESIKKSGERAAAVVADLLTVARESAAVYEISDLNHIIAGYVSTPDFKKLRALHPLVEFDISPSPDLWSCTCSPIHIQKTVMNLVINAFEAIKTQGKVEIATTNIEQTDVTAIADNLKPTSYVAFTVKDSGAGISDEDLKKIFDPFFSKKRLGRSGTGLGLTVAWNTIREHGGTITVKSNSKGTVFTVLIPATHASPLPKIPLSDLSNLQGNGEHILVVDDEEALREIAVKMLEVLCYKASSVGSGEEALAFLRSSLVDLVILDMQMDPGMGGRETYEQIKILHPQQKALITTGFSTSQDVELTLQQGAGSLIKKPYSIIELGQAVRELLRRN